MATSFALVASIFGKRFGRLPAIQAYAPGRIELIGNHVDYNGGSVLGVALDRGITVAMAARTDKRARIFSESLEEEITVSLDDLRPFAARHSWADYPLGVFLTLREEGFAISGGFDLLVSSDLPAGAGMGSSAALSVATAYALTALHSFEIDQKELLRICCRAENEFVGMPCGILDQGVSIFGAPGHLVKIDSLTQRISRIPLPPRVQLWIIDSNRKHALVSSAYAERRRECEEVFAILRSVIPSAVCLAYISVKQVRAYHHLLTDSQYKRARHVTEENARVAQAVSALQEGNLVALGKLLISSHRSSQNLFENSSAEQDYLVDQLISEPGVFGARLSGGGFGGAVVALTDEAFGKGGATPRIANGYEITFGRKLSGCRIQASQGARVIEG
jgi:galactokinase